MAKEIERKFLVSSNSFIDLAIDKIVIKQGYLSTNPTATVRVRIANDKGFITIKGKTEGISRDEYEYQIPLNDALGMMQLCARRIEKTRYIVPYQGFEWEVDVFDGFHQGLIIAEVELSNADLEVPLPSFVGKEVTGNPAYYNSNLSKNA